MDRTGGLKTPVRRGRSGNDQCDGGPLPSETTGTQESGKQSKRRTRRRKNRRCRKTEATEDTNVERAVQDGERNQPSRDRTTNQQVFSDEQNSPSRRRFKASIQELLSENDPYIDVDDDDFDEKFVFNFMTKGEDGRRRLNKANFVDSVCPPITIEELLANPSSGPLRKRFLVDDRTNDGTVSISLGDRVPLTVQELYLKLKQKRFHELSLQGTSAPLNVDRRLIFITDPDHYGIAALMLSASDNQVIALGDAIYRYMAFKPRIQASIEARGFPTFSLSFHLPFYAWRSVESRQKLCDIRVRRDRTPLRKVFDIGVLGGKTIPQSTPRTIDYLCEAQISVLVAGIDDCRWTGYCFVDTYYQPADRRESVHKYNEDEDDTWPDPFTEGTCDANFPLLNPREYFLAVLNCRAELFKDEWESAADKLEELIDTYLKKCPFMSLQSTPPGNTEYNEALSWIGQTKDRLRQLIRCLRATIRRWECFEPNEHFRTAAGLQLLSSIQETFLEVGHCAEQLESLFKRCDDHAKHLTLYMSGEGNRDIKLQAQITYFLLYFVYPTTLAAAMLSMQEKAIPGFLGPSKSSFVVLATVLTLAVFILIRIMHHWKNIQPFGGEWVKRERVQGLVWGDRVGTENQEQDPELGERTRVS